MKFKFTPLFFLFIYTVICYGQVVNNYGLTVVNDTAFYHKAIDRDSLNKMVNLEKFIPGIKLDIKYATADNFSGIKVYDKPMAFLRLPAAYALKKVEAELNKQGLGLKVYDAYRPYSVTILFYDKIRDTDFVASPWQGSRHNRGCAVDLTLINLKTGKELDMPTKIDDFTLKAHPDYNDISDSIKNNRALLFNVMKKNGFTGFPTEWWHFDFSGWSNYFLMDLKFEELE